MTQVAHTPAPDLTEEELEALLAKRRRERLKAEEKERKQYVEQRDIRIRNIIHNAMSIEEILTGFKRECHQAMEEQWEALDKYGSIPGNSKGGFSIVDAEGNFKIKRLRSTQPHWDERSEKAVDLIADFLKDTVKKRDQKIYEVLISFIQRNEKGDLEYSKVMNLMQHRDKFEDERWITGLRLIQESYSVHLRGYGYEFLQKDSEGKWQPINISFTAIKAEVQTPKTDTDDKDD